jgi:hypothetical protein
MNGEAALGRGDQFEGGLVAVEFEQSGAGIGEADAGAIGGRGGGGSRDRGRGGGRVGREAGSGISDGEEEVLGSELGLEGDGTGLG